LAALVNFEFAIGKLEIVSLIGPNGAGKTTFFNVLAGELGPTKGDLRFQGKSIVGLKPEQIAKLGIARTFQNIRLFKGMTVAENVRVALGCHSEYSLFESFLGGSKVRNQEGRGREEILTLLDFVGLANVHAELAANLPYGSQKRLELARALALRPNLLLLDEPTAGMNPHETAELMELIKKIRDRQTAIIVIEHDMKVVMGISERVIVGAFSRPDRKRYREDAEAVFEQFPVLKARQNQLGGKLSGGEQQMLAIGRALMSKPELLLLDEPSLGLSPILAKTIWKTIRAINQKGMTVLLVEQNAAAALHLSEKGYVMETGRITMEDRCVNLLQNEEIRNAYLG
jgi:branched-chain amino acid transport system ATP-binding protein